MRLAFSIAGVALAALPLSAQESCAPLPDHGSLKEELYTELRIAIDPTDARFASDKLWALWLTAPDLEAQQLLDEGLRRIRVGDYAGARDELSALIDYCPDYAEGYNQRAYAAFLARDFEAALGDLNLALERDPRHLGALTGKALTLIGMGEEEAAQEPLRDALRLNRWLAERALLTGPMEEET